MPLSDRQRAYVQELRRFHDAHGHLQIPKRYITEDGRALGLLVACLRIGFMPEVRDELVRLGLWTFPPPTAHRKERALPPVE